MTSLTLKPYGKPEISRNVVDPWTYLGGPLGVREYWDGTLDVTTGVVNGDGRGGVHIERLSCAGAELRDFYMLPQQRLRLRTPVSYVEQGEITDRPAAWWKLPLARTSWTSKARDQFAAAQGAIQSRTPISYLESEAAGLVHVGPWSLIGSADYPYPHGGAGKEMNPGSERSSSYRLLFADLIGARHQVDCVRAATGEPADIATSGYAGDAWWSKAGKLPEFCKPIDPSNPWDDRRVPRDWNVGTATTNAQRDELMRYGPFWKSHLIHAMRHAMAGWFLYGDEACRWDLRMIAQDASYVWTAARCDMIKAAGKNVGHSSIGREVGWCLLAAVVGKHEALRRRLVDLIAWKMATYPLGMGTHLPQRKSFGEGGLSPDPWASGWISTSLDVAFSMEMCIVIQALEAAGEHEMAARMGSTLFDACMARFGRTPKVLCVADRNGRGHRGLRSAGGPPEDWFVWTPLAIQRRLDLFTHTSVPEGSPIADLSTLRAAMVAKATARLDMRNHLSAAIGLLDEVLE